MREYIKQYWTGPAVFMLFTGIFLLISYLYGTNMEGVLYAFLLCLLLGSIFAVSHFIFSMRRHREREEITECLPPELILEKLTKPSGLAEKDYDRILRVVLMQYKKDKVKWRRERSDMMDYFGTWVHQIKTPISAMDMRLQMEDTDISRACLRDLFRIRQYVEMVLCYMRLDDEGNDLVLQSCSLDEIIREVIHKFAGEFVYKRLSLSYDSLDYQVLTDEKWLSFILEQILSNAIKYTSKGGISIYMEGEVLVIEDTGIGIAKEDVPRIFEKGYTGYNGRADKKATGLGLYLCRCAAKMLSHGIWVESEAGVGTRVFLNLHRERVEME